jgi:hypothetical protein
MHMMPMQGKSDKHDLKRKKEQKGEKSLVLVGLRVMLVKEFEQWVCGNCLLRTHGIRITKMRS